MPPAENVRQVFIGITEDGAPPGGGGTYFFKDSTGLAEFLRINGLAEQSVDLLQGHESVERDRGRKSSGSQARLPWKLGRRTCGDCAFQIR